MVSILNGRVQNAMTIAVTNIIDPGVEMEAKLIQNTSSRKPEGLVNHVQNGDCITNKAKIPVIAASILSTKYLDLTISESGNFLAENFFGQDNRTFSYILKRTPLMRTVITPVFQHTWEPMNSMDFTSPSMKCCEISIEAI